MRERAGTHGGLLQTGVDIACRLGQLPARRHFDVGAFIDGSVDYASGLDDHNAAALGSDDTAVEHGAADPSASGQHHASEVSARLLLARSSRGDRDVMVIGAAGKSPAFCRRKRS